MRAALLLAALLLAPLGTAAQEVCPGLPSRIPSPAEALPAALLEGFEWDLAGRRYRTIKDLEAYVEELEQFVYKSGAFMKPLFAAAKSRVREGGRAVLADRDADKGRAVAAELGDAARFVTLDVTQEPAWQQAVAAAGSPIPRAPDAAPPPPPPCPARLTPSPASAGPRTGPGPTERGPRWARRRGRCAQPPSGHGRG